MQSYRKEAKLILVWLLILCGSAGKVVAQSPNDGVSIRLSVSDSQVTKSTKPTATIVVENRTGRQIGMSEFVFFSLELQLNSRPPGSCRLNECYSAALSPGTKTIENGGSLTFVVKLNDLYWHNSISSIELLNRPKNLFWVPPGRYDLYAQLSTKRADWTQALPRYESIESSPVVSIVLMRKP